MPKVIESNIKHFINIWNEINSFIQPTKEAIREKYFSKQHHKILNWDMPEFDDNNNIILGLCYYPSSREDGDRRKSFVMPLDICLAGKNTVLKYFEEEERKQQEAAKEMGRKREVDERAKRYAQFVELKNEFEPPEGAITKHKGVM